MADMTCDKGVFCPGSENPLNFTEEGPEIPFLATVFTNNPPPLGRPFTATGCVGVCTSLISQEDAELCAQRQAVQCTHDGQCPECPDTPPLIGNDPISCTVLCPDGLPFTYTVGAGLFIGTSKTDLNQQAYQFACNQAQRFKICLGNIPRCTCVGHSYSARILASGSSDLTWFIDNGTIPPGLDISFTPSAAFISGIPTVNGTYTFTLRAVSQAGTFMIKPFTIVVLEITTTALPGFTVGVPYSFQLVASGGSNDYNWKITSGSLPDGLSMSITGLITGTPA